MEGFRHAPLVGLPTVLQDEPCVIQASLFCCSLQKLPILLLAKRDIRSYYMYSIV